MKPLWRRCAGVSLIELLVTLGLGASLSAAILQLFVGSTHRQSVHSAVQDLQHRSAYAQFLLRTGIYSSASPCLAGNTEQSSESVHLLEALPSATAPVNALPGTQVLVLRTPDCDAPVHFYYIARRGNDDGNPAGLFRRRQGSDGSYDAAEELVEGVSAMTVAVGISAPQPATVPGANAVVAYVAIDQVTDWSQVFSVNITLSLRILPESAEGSLVSGDLSAVGLTLEFSTALRQTELHRLSQGS